MPYQDTWAICTQCEKRFVFRVEDQRRLDERGETVTPPKLCPVCQGTTQERERTRQPDGSRERKPSRPASPEQPALGPGPHEGIVKWFEQEKGYGFIAQSNNTDIFFHRTGLAFAEDADIQENMRVTYCIEHTEKGPQAVDVECLDDPGS